MLLDISNRHMVHVIQREFKVAVGAHNLDGKIWSSVWTKNLPLLPYCTQKKYILSNTLFYVFISRPGTGWSLVWCRSPKLNFMLFATENFWQWQTRFRSHHHHGHKIATMVTHFVAPVSFSWKKYTIEDTNQTATCARLPVHFGGVGHGKGVGGYYWLIVYHSLTCQDPSFMHFLIVYDRYTLPVCGLRSPAPFWHLILPTTPFPLLFSTDVYIFATNNTHAWSFMKPACSSVIPRCVHFTLTLPA